MILSGIDPSKILLTTFTNKAANEMKERIVKVVGEQGKKITVGTYHSICNRILRQYCTEIGYIRTFTILDEDEANKLTREIAKEFGEDIASLRTFISNCKTKCKTPEIALQEAQANNTTRLSNCYKAYQDKLKQRQCMDFDDLLLNTVLLLESNLEIKRAINNRWQYISSDETQDSSELDARLMYALSGNEHNIFFVGDDDQSLYGFRGAEVQIILNLKTRYPALKTYTLGINYRSTKHIVEAGQEIISFNKYKLEKEVRCGRDIQGTPIIRSVAKNQQEEARKVVAFIKTLHKRKEPIPYNEMAILYRTSHLSRVFEKELMKAQIKYKLIGGTPFFCREEVKDILAYAKLTVNEFDMQSFKRTIGIPKRGIGDKTLEKIDEYMLNNIEFNASIRQAINSDEISKIVKGKALKGLKKYNKFLNTLDLKKNELSPEEFLRFIIQDLNYLDYLIEKHKDDCEERIENINELVMVAKEYTNIEDLLIEASLYNEKDNEDDADAVQLMTIHKSKGLEFDAVFMTNLVEGSCPHYKSLDDPMQLEEERRIMFVGCTRAKKHLFLTYPKEQIIMNTPRYVKPSRFLNEIDRKHIKVI